MAILGLVLMLLMSVAAVRDDGLMIKMYNDGADAIVLSVYDMNSRPPEAVIANQRINGFSWVPLSVTAGAMGKGHVKWIARTVDPGFHRCGYQEMHGVGNGVLVYVSTNSGCRKIMR